MNQKYKHLAEHKFGLDTSGLLREELKPYLNEIREMAEKYNASSYYVQRTIAYLTFRKMRRGRESDLESSVETVERWLRKTKNKRHWESLI